MAAFKLKKYPKKPKATASVQTLERYLARVKEIDRENQRIKSERTKHAGLRKRVASIGRAN